jgi:hypothetical protein
MESTPADSMISHEESADALLSTVRFTATRSGDVMRVLLWTRGQVKILKDQKQILRLTTPKLKSAWGPVRSE